MTKIRRNLPNNQYLAAILANSPSTSNVFATIADLADLGTAITSASKLQHDVKYAEQINKGQAVYVSSADGTNMIVSKASNATEGTSSKTMGLVLATGNANYQGTVVTEGLLSGLNTNGSNAGDPVWLGVNGDLIFGLLNKPVAPTHLVFIGIVTRANTNNGEIFVKVQNGFELHEIHDVSLPSYTNKGVLYRDVATNLWKHATIETILGYTPANSTFTIATSGPLNGASDLSGVGMTLSISQATNTTAGYLSSTDWTTFNNKVPTTRSISTTAPLSGGGNLSLDRTISIPKATTTIDGYLSATDWTTFNSKQAALGFTPANKAGDTFTGNIFAANLSGTNTGDESTASVKAKLGAATSTLDGYLTFQDWVIFNAKQNAIGYTPANKAGETFTGSISATNLSNTNTGDETTVSIKTKLGSASSTIDGYLLATDWVIFNSKVSTTRTISTTAPLNGGGDLSGNLTLSMSQASASANGYLTSSDWSTFSGKQNALGYTPANIAGDTFTGAIAATNLSGTNTGDQSLQQVTDIGNTTTNDIQFGTGKGALLNNGSRLREGTINAGFGGAKGIAQICAVGYELKWEAGRLYVMDGNGVLIRHSLYNFTTLPSATDDSSKGYYVGSLWSLDNGISYICTDSTLSAATWDIYAINPQVKADWNATTGDAQILNKPTIPSITGLATTSYVNTQDALKVDIVSGKSLVSDTEITRLSTVVNYDNSSNVTALANKVDKVTGSRLITSAESTLLGNTSGVNSGDETTATIKTKLGVTTLSGSNTGDESTATIKTKLGAASASQDGYLTSTDWSIFSGSGGGTVTSVAALTISTTGLDISSTVATGTTTPVITLVIPTASSIARGALSSADWSTFNGKIGGSGTIGYLPKFTGSTTLGNSIIQDDGSKVGINTAPLTGTVLVVGAGGNTAITATASSTGKNAVYGTNIGDSAGSRTAAFFEAYPSDTPINTNIYIGGRFFADGPFPYAVQLQDGTQGVGKFLKSITSDGKANWATMSVADTGLTITSTGTSGAATLVGNTLNIPQYSGGGSAGLDYGQMYAAASQTFLI